MRTWITIPLVAVVTVFGLPVIPGMPGTTAAQAADYRSTILADNPVSYWRLGQGAASSVTADEQGVNGAVLNEGPQGGRPGAIIGDTDTATYFQGQGWALVNGPTDRLRTQRLSVEAWFNSPSDATGNRPIFAASSQGVRLGLVDGRPTATLPYGIQNAQWQVTTVTANTSFADGLWHHVAVVHDDSSLRLYVDGGLVGYAGFGAPVLYPYAYTNVTIGTESLNDGLKFVGSLDEMAYYDHALTQDQVQAHYKAAGYTLKPVGGAITAAENPCNCSPGAPNVGATQASVGAPVNTATGNFWHSFEGIFVPGRGPALDFRPTFSSQSGLTNGPLGYGWTHSYAVALTLPPSGVVTLTEENSAQLTFTPAGAGYSAPPRVTATLVHNTDGTFTVTRDAGEVLAFDASGRLLSLKDRNGYQTSLSYTGGQLTTITDGATRTLTLGYTSGRITSVTDNAGQRVLRFAYDGAGNMSDMTDIGNGLWHFTYDASHRMLTMLDPAQAGSATPVPLTNHYDASGRVDWQKDFLGRQTSFDYVSTPGSTKVTDPKGNVTVYQYEYGLLTKLTRAPGTSSQAVWAYSYEPATLGLTSIIDPKLHATSMTYDARGNRLSATDPLNRTSRWTYGPFDNVTSYTDGKLVTTTYEYDATGNLKRTWTPLSPGTGTQQVILNYNDPAHRGDVTSLVDADNNTWNYGYDPATGDLLTITDPVTPTRGTTKFCYDAIGRRLATISPKGTVAGVVCPSNPPPPSAPFTTTTTYDSFGRPLVVTDPLGHQTVTTYDADGRMKTTKDPDNNLTAFTYDTAGELTDTLRADTTHLRQDYWPDGSLYHSYDGANQATTYTYDPLGRVATQTDPDNRTTTFGYDLNGNRTTVQQPGGNCLAATKTACVTYGFDDANQVTAITYSDTPSANVTAVGYDNDGQRTSMSDATGPSSWAWDSLRRLTSSTTGGATTGYGYDLKGQLTQITYPGTTGSVIRGYDEAGHLKTVTDWANRQSQFNYDADGFMTSGVNPAANGITATYTPDGADRLMGITDTKASTTLASFTYGRDAANQVNSVSSTGVPADNHSYSYTQLNQLKNVDGVAYTYSPADNLTGTPSGTSMGYDAANQATSLTQGTGTSTLGYDSLGNRTSATPAGGPATALTYNQANRLTSVDAGAFPTAIAAGWYFSLGVKADGTVWAWGSNTYGQLGNNSTTDASVPVQVQGLTGVVAVAAGAYQASALKADGTVWTWGSNAYGQLGNNSTVDSHVPVQVQGLSGVVAIAAGASHTLALKADGTIWAWGYNAYGQLGNNTVADAHVPVQVQGLSGVTAIAGGYVHSAALRSDGTVWAWGYNAYGQLGNNSTTDAHLPVQAQGLTGVSAIASGWFHMLALKADATVSAWGFNSNGQLGNNSVADAHLPQAVPGLSAVASIAASTYQSFAQKTDGALWDWGQNPLGQLGNGAVTDVHVPTASGLSGLKGLAPGPNHTLALRADGTVAAWGWNGVGSLGNGTTIDARTPVTVVTSAPRSYSATVAGGWFHSLAVKNDGTVWASGYNGFGELGNNSTTDSSVPVQVSGLTGVVAVAAGAYNSAALKSDGTVWAWGYNANGQVGNNTTVDAHVPVQVQGLSGITAIAAGTSHLLALKSDGTVWAWGYNSNGQVGNNATTDALVPVQVQGLSGATGIAGGYTHSVAVKSDGTVWAWGYNGYGQLGNNTVTDAHTATQVPGLTGVAGVSAGFFHTLALRSDGTVSAWGYNAYGELGNNSTTDSHVPVAVSGLSSVATIAAGSYHSYVLKHDGTVWDFGLNNYGQLGNNSTTDAHVPIATGVANAIGLAAGYIHVLVPRADGTLTAWGYNAYGQLGNNTVADAHVPVSVTGFNRGGSFLTRGTGARATYAYNGDGLRTSKAVAGATKSMAWDMAEAVPALLSDGTSTYVYGPGGLPIEQVDGTGNVLYFEHDQGGSTRLLSDASGAVVATFTYDAYGKLTASTGSATTPFGYAGQYTDAETGFVYLRARYYDPSTGQFISRDPLVALTRSAYGYVDGNPLNGTDPAGMDSCAGVVDNNGTCHPNPVLAPIQFLSPLGPIRSGIVCVTSGFDQDPCGSSLVSTGVSYAIGTVLSPMVNAVLGALDLVMSSIPKQEGAGYNGSLDPPGGSCIVRPGETRTCLQIQDDLQRAARQSANAADCLAGAYEPLGPFLPGNEPVGPFLPRP